MSDLPQRKGRPAYMQPHQFGGEPEQLKMFMTRGEIAKDYVPIDRTKRESVHRFWTGKLRESKVAPDPDPDFSLHGAGVYESVRETGVQSPVHLAHEDTVSATGKAIVGGHHRIISARKNELIPVMHHTSFREAARGRSPWELAYGREYT